jgi:hypothetical protein
LVVCIHFSRYSPIKLCNYLLLFTLACVTLLPPWFASVVTSPYLKQLTLWGLGFAGVFFSVWLWRGLSKRTPIHLKCWFELADGVLTILQHPRVSPGSDRSDGQLYRDLASQYRILPSSRVSPWLLFLKLQLIDKESTMSGSRVTSVKDVVLLPSSVSKRTYRALACCIFRSQQKDKVSK